MIRKHLLLKALPALGLLTLLLVLVMYFIHSQRVAAREAVVKAYMEVEVQETLKSRSAKVAQILSSVYENARMVSLLPGVRSIQGGNRPSDSDDVVAQGRFSKHDYDVVQQIYNNLASAVNVSEVYIVLNGFDATKGEVPFLMLDQLIIGDRSNEDATQQKQNSDIPEESEADEYDYFPQQLQDLKKRFPNFGFDKLEQIPMVASPVMRTCDNTQYTSVSKGDVRDAGGILFSVPIYSTTKDLIGVVVVVVRSNVLEAAILDVPNLIVTEEDAARAAQEQWKIPAVSSLRLTNPDYGVDIFDRRNALFDTSAEQSNALILPERQIEVAAPLGTRWNLSYRIDPAKVYAMERQADQGFYLPVFFTILIYLLLVGSILFYTNMRLFLERLRQLLASLRQLASGDFHVQIPHQQRKGEIGEIAQAIVSMQATAIGAAENAWIRKTLSSVDVALQSSVSFLEFGNALATALHRSVAFDFFALYVFDKDRQGLRRSGGFACEDQQATHCRLGEGLVGQVAADGRAMQLSQAAGHQLHVQTGTLILPVQHILVLPITKSGQVLGVIEVGSIQPLRTVDRALFDEVLPVLADKIEILQGHIEQRELLTQLRAS